MAHPLSGYVPAFQHQTKFQNSPWFVCFTKKRLLTQNLNFVVSLLALPSKWKSIFLSLDFTLYFPCPHREDSKAKAIKFFVILSIYKTLFLFHDFGLAVGSNLVALSCDFGVCFGILYVFGLVIVGDYYNINLSVFVVVCVNLFVGCLWWFLLWLWRWFYVVLLFNVLYYYFQS